jgi:dipeptidyl aminopeptidase/acylaminoacyl peptidase
MALGKHQNTYFRLAVLSLWALFATIGSAQAPLTVRQIMAEPSIAGMRPEGQKISPDGKLVAFTWNAKGVEPRDLYLVPTATGPAQLLVSAVSLPVVPPADPKPASGPPKDEFDLAREKNISGVDWSPDSSRLLFIQKGDLWVVAASEGSVPQRLTRTDTAESGAYWLPNGNRILYQSNGNLFVMQLDGPMLVQVTKDGVPPSSPTGGTSLGTVTPSWDGKSVAYVASDTAKQRALFVPNYLGEFATAPTFRRGWNEQTVQVVATDGSSTKPLAVKLPGAEASYYVRGLRWTKDNKVLVVDRIDRDTKRRQLFRVDPATGTSSLIDEETDAKWVAGLSRIVEPSPDGQSLLFGSERDGFNHLYLISLNVGDAGAHSEVKQLTRGNWEVDWAKWLPDGRGILFSSTKNSTATRAIQWLDPATGTQTALRLPDGMNTSAALSENGSALLFEHSEWDRPNDLYTIQICASCSMNSSARQLTESVPAAFAQVKWAKPEFTEFTAKDGKTVKARIYMPNNFDRKKKYPAVVFVHGAGYLQNVVNGWNNYYREAMFNTVLTQRGYVVLDIDYRGSAGYGREWRTDVYDFLGGLDLQDHLDGIDFIVKNYSVDKARIGMYGGSYGGFMAEMAAMRAPEYIACAAALRPVADWKNYFASSPVYTTERLGFPDKNTEAYRRSSPISYADKLTRPLLILHGMVDDNVHFQDSAQLIDKLVKLGKTDYFEAMFYPSENHGFVRPEAWTDEYERILRFFDQHLKLVAK